MNEQIDAIKSALREMIEQIIANDTALSEEEHNLVAGAMEHAASRITQLRRQEQEAGAAQEPTINRQPPSEGEQLLWILAGQDKDAFVKYLSTYPDPAFSALLRNPTRLEQTIGQLSSMMPQGAGNAPPPQDGIEHADLNSSNIYGFQYDPGSKGLKVRFQNGGVYAYEGVPPWIFQLFKQGAVAATTNGQNQYGRWWTGKQPSLGASFYRLIRNGGYPYQQISGGREQRQLQTA